MEDSTESRTISLLLGNKRDLKGFREVSEESARHCQEEMGIDMYREVSALDSQGGIQETLGEYLGIISQ